MKINCEMPGAYVFSSGKNMGAFKAVGFPAFDVGVFYQLDEYEGYSWTAHGRYPTNTPGWWGGAHLLLCWIILSFITVKYLLMMQTADLSKCSVINALCKPIPRLLLISWITSFACRSCLSVKRQA